MVPNAAPSIRDTISPMTDAPPPALSRLLSVLIGAAALVITVAGMRLASELLIPILLSATIAVCVYPLIGRFERWGLPRRFAVLATITTMVAALIAVSYAVFWSLTRLATLVPRYRPQVIDWFEDLRLRAEEAGFGSEQLQSLLADVDYGQTISLAAGIASSMLGLVATAFAVIFLSVVMVADAPRFAAALQGARRDRSDFVAALTRATVRARADVINDALFGLGAAIVVTIVLWLLGVPGAPVWGVLTFLTNFIPTVGFVIRIVPPSIVAALEGGWGLAIATVVVFIVVNILDENVLRSHFAERNTGLSATANLLSVVFWTFALGAVGALLAIPLTIFAKALLVEVDPRTRWISPFFGSTRPAEPPPS